MARKSIRQKRYTKKRRRKSRKKRGMSKRRRRRRTKRVKRRGKKMRQRGGYGKCQNPFQGKYVPYEPVNDIRRGVLTRQLAGQRGGASVWRNLGLTWPKDTFNDAKDFLLNVKNRYVGDRQSSTSNVMDQPIANNKLNPAAPGDYSKAFIDADKAVALKIKSMTE